MDNALLKKLQAKILEDEKTKTKNYFMKNSFEPKTSQVIQEFSNNHFVTSVRYNTAQKINNFIKSLDGVLVSKEKKFESIYNFKKTCIEQEKKLISEKKQKLEKELKARIEKFQENEKRNSLQNLYSFQKKQLKINNLSKDEIRKMEFDYISGLSDFDEDTCDLLLSVSKNKALKDAMVKNRYNESWLKSDDISRNLDNQLSEIADYSEDMVPVSNGSGKTFQPFDILIDLNGIE